MPATPFATEDRSVTNRRHGSQEHGMERLIESMLLGLRWMLLPLYLALFAAVVTIYVMVARELFDLAAHLGTVSDSDLVLLLCAVLDLVLVANLMVMVAVSSYESFISRIAVDTPDRPEWLGKLDLSNVKVKVAVGVTMISMIHLLRAFMAGEPGQRLMVLAAVHLVFVASALGVALVDRTQRGSGSH
jgi:uncharacterized protein (TIGR00645 family)